MFIEMDTKKDRWNRVASVYAKDIEEEESSGSLIRQKVLLPHLFRSIQKVYNKKVLDYGCGDGWLCQSLQRMGAKVTGVDISERFLKLAKKRASNIRYLLIEDNKVMLPDSSFDLVVCVLVLHVTRYCREAIKEISRLLVPGGSAIIVIMHPKHWKIDKATPGIDQEQMEVKVEETIPVIYYRRPKGFYESLFREAGFIIDNEKECTSEDKMPPGKRKYERIPYFLIWKLKKA